MREFFGVDGVDRIPQAEGELLINAVLDDSISISGVPAQVAFAIHGLVFVGIAMDMCYAEKGELDAVIARAEDIAIDRGASPTLVADG